MVSTFTSHDIIPPVHRLRSVINFGLIDLTYVGVFEYVYATNLSGSVIAGCSIPSVPTMMFRARTTATPRLVTSHLSPPTRSAAFDHNRDSEHLRLGFSSLHVTHRIELYTLRCASTHRGNDKTSDSYLLHEGIVRPGED